MSDILKDVELLIKDCAEMCDARALHIAQIAMSANLANLASVALLVPSDGAPTLLAPIMSVAIRVDGALVASIPDDDYRLLARAALRLLEHALDISIRLHLNHYVARQRLRVADSLARLGVKDLVEVNVVAALEYALLANDSMLASQIAVRLGIANIRAGNLDNGLYMAEIAANTLIRASIDDHMGHNEGVDEISKEACALALKSCDGSSGAKARAILVLEKLKAIRAANLSSVGASIIDAVPSELGTERARLIEKREQLRAEALLADDEPEVAAELEAVSTDVERLRYRIEAIVGRVMEVTDSRSMRYMTVMEAFHLLERIGPKTTLWGVYYDEQDIWAYALWRESAELILLDDWSTWPEDLDKLLGATGTAHVLGGLEPVTARLLRPLARRLSALRPEDRLIFSPFGRFARVPLDAMMSIGGSVLAEHLTLSLVPGLGMLEACVERRAFEATSVIAVGAPTRTIRQPPLFSMDEARTVARHFTARNKQSVLLLGREATSSAVRDAAQRHSIVHLACHGDWGDGVSRLGCIYLAEAADGSESGVVTAADVASTYRLMPGCLVVLAACETGEINVAHHDDANALVQAFMIAGASSVVATRWAVRDRATSVLMNAFYARIAAGEPIAAALASTVRDARSGSLGVEVTEAEVWAAFVLFGR
jgi:hypothetical protein